MLWAESPQHAIKKAKSRVSPDCVVTELTVEEIGEVEDGQD